jgi:hypothetical protein
MHHERLVGRVVIEWSRLEAVLNDLIWCFLNVVFEDGRSLTGRADAGTKITLLRAIAPQHLSDDDKLEALLLVLDMVDASRDDRNFIVHGSWGRLAPEGIPLAASIRIKSKPDEVIAETFPPKRMRDIADNIVRMRKMLVLLLDELYASPDTLLK